MKMWDQLPEENRPHQIKDNALVFQGFKSRTLLGRYYLVAGNQSVNENWFVYFINESGQVFKLASRRIFRSDEDYKVKILKSPPYNWAKAVYETLENFTEQNCRQCSKDYNKKLEKVADAAEELLSEWSGVELDHSHPAVKKLADTLYALGR